MSYLVSDLIINPVLRQAQRFSRSNAPSDRQPVASGLLNNAASDTESHGAPSLVSDISTLDSLSGAPIVSSPIEEHGGLEEELAGGQYGRSRSMPGVAEPVAAMPLRLASLRSDRGSVDGDVSDNPSYGIPGRFQHGSTVGGSYTSTIPNGAASRTPTEVPARRGTQDAGLEAVPVRHRNSSLPEDDGMKEMRRRIIQIQGMDADAVTKARLMHQLFAEEYQHSQAAVSLKVIPRSQSPISIISQERPSTPASLSSFSFWQSNTPPRISSPTPTTQTFHLSEEDLQPTYTTIIPRLNKENSDYATKESQAVADASTGPHVQQGFGCAHYKRNVKMQCSACDKWYTCRFCHDEVEDHVLIRKDTKNMLCMFCGSPQKAGEVCADCGARAASYYCSKCKLWDDDTTKSIYHCDDCGICRIGSGLGKDYTHCMTCGVCILISKEHKCIERASDCDCPICGEYLFNSLHTVVFMKCGHSIHQKCYRELMKTSYKCPICSQSVVNMETQFRNLDRAIESQPMPPQFQDTHAMVSCNDCYAKSIVKYHWLGLKCAVCDSYNTAQLQIMSETAQPESVPAPADIIPGPRADLFIENMQPPAPPRIRRQRPTEPRPGRIRRHSSHIGSTLTVGPTTSSRFMPYPAPQRIGRSVSPVRGNTFRDEPMADAAAEEIAVASEDEDELDRWGGDFRSLRALRSIGSNDDLEMVENRDGDELEDDEDSEMDSVSDIETDDDDDDDEDDGIALFGHR